MTTSHDPRDGMFTVGRPWGMFQQFATNEQVTVKIITVLPGHRLSLQTHKLRDEFWHVIAGPVTVVIDGQTRVVQPDGEVWVPKGSEHRLINEGERPARILEIAYGSFDEEDIVRIEDDYAR